MKIVRTVLWTCGLLGSLALPIFFLAVRHFHLEDETAHWLVSMWPRSQGSLALRIGERWPIWWSHTESWQQRACSCTPRLDGAVHLSIREFSNAWRKIRDSSAAF